MLFFSIKNLKIINKLGVLGIAIAVMPTVASDIFTATLENLPEKEIRRERDRTNFRYVVVNYKNLTNKTLMAIKNKPSSIVFSKVLMCSDKVYPTVLVRTIRKDIPKEYKISARLFIYNELLEEVQQHQESLVISNEFTDSPDKFTVGVQPKFTLDTVEAFVCNSQVNLCNEDEEITYQCTFENGRQANMCNGDGRPPNVLRVGKSLSQLDINYRVFGGYKFHKYSKTTEGQGNSLSGVGKTLSFTEGDLEYAFERHWNARSRDDYDFHAEFNVRKDGKIIESHRCIEGNYE